MSDTEKELLALLKRVVSNEILGYIHRRSALPDPFYTEIKATVEKYEQLADHQSGGFDIESSADGYQGISRIKRWNSRKGDHVIVAHADLFVDDLIAVYKKHKLALAHEDCHGSFQICDYDERLVSWLQHAHDETRPRTGKP